MVSKTMEWHPGLQKHQGWDRQGIWDGQRPFEVGNAWVDVRWCLSAKLKTSGNLARHASWAFFFSSTTAYHHAAVHSRAEPQLCVFMTVMSGVKELREVEREKLGQDRQLRLVEISSGVTAF